MAPKKKAYTKEGKKVPNGKGHTGKRDSLAQWGASIKKGCTAEFMVKVLYLQRHIALICFIQVKHCNQYGLHVHGKERPGDRSAFAAHLSKDIKTWVVKQLDLNLSVSQIMALHRLNVKKIMDGQQEITRDLFLTDQDVRYLSNKKAKETYQFHPHDALSVKMWVQQNTESVFYYQETTSLVGGSLNGDNMPFTIGIQTPWQLQMMLRHGHHSAVAMDATFGSNEKKVLHDIFSATL